MFDILKKDIERTSIHFDGTLKKVIGCYRTPGVHAIITYRFGRWLKMKSTVIRVFLEPFYLFFAHRMRTKWGIEIPRAAELGEGVYIGHHGGIIISPKSKIGKNANLSHQITIGVSGQGEKYGVPVIGDNVYIAPGAKIFGKIFIGDNVKIGANAVVNKDIPSDVLVVVGTLCKIISRK